jgi:hypothetical protein
LPIEKYGDSIGTYKKQRINNNMLTFKEFSDKLDAEEDLFINLGEMGDEGIPLQEEIGGIIAFDRYAEKYAEYLKQIGIKNLFVGVFNSDEQLQMIEIWNNKVQYKVGSVFKGLALQVIALKKPETIQEFCDRAERSYESDGTWFIDKEAEVATFVSFTTYDLDDWDAVYFPNRRSYEMFLNR